MKLERDDEVISLSILHRVGTTPEEREEYLRFAPWKPEKEGEPTLSAERIAEMAETRAVHPHRLRQWLWQAVIGL